MIWHITKEPQTFILVQMQTRASRKLQNRVKQNANRREIPTAEQENVISKKMDPFEKEGKTTNFLDPVKIESTCSHLNLLSKSK